MKTLRKCRILQGSVVSYVTSRRECYEKVKTIFQIIVAIYYPNIFVVDLF